MKRSKKTKRMLVMSLISILLTVVLLAGSTFAWFKDNATSGVNVIVAGNLDVELYHSNSSLVTEEKVTDATQLFNVTLWEPGVMAYETFKVKNAGELALKYKFAMLVGNYNKILHTEKSLKDVLKVAIVDNFDGTRDSVTDLEFKTLNDFVKTGSLTKANLVDEFTVVVYWEPTDNDNDYNLIDGNTTEDEEPLSIELGISIIATQNSSDDSESDSFGYDYDEDAQYDEVEND